MESRIIAYVQHFDLYNQQFPQNPIFPRIPRPYPNTRNVQGQQDQRSISKRGCCEITLNICVHLYFITNVYFNLKYNMVINCDPYIYITKVKSIFKDRYIILGI